MRRVYASTGERVQSALRKKRMTLAAGICIIAVIIVMVVVRLGPPPKSVLDSSLVTYNCTDVAATSLRAHADIIDDGGEWVTRRGFQYSEGDSGNLPDIIPLANASFEYGNPPTGWGAWQTSIERVDNPVKLGDYSVKITIQEGSAGVMSQLNPIAASEAEERTFTFGAWVYATASDRVRLVIQDTVAGHRADTRSACHPGDGNWYWLTVTRTLRSDLDSWNVHIRIDEGSAISIHADGVFFVRGSELNAIFEDGDFGTGAYGLTIAGLKRDTSYRVRAFADNEAGVVYGDVVSCKTLG